MQLRVRTADERSGDQSSARTERPAITRERVAPGCDAGHDISRVWRRWTGLKTSRSRTTDAAAAGVTLGPLVSVSNEAQPSLGGVYYGPIYPATGSFGPGQYCGTVRTRSVHVDQNGKRHYGKPKAHRVCRVPPVVQRAVALTFALA